MGLFVYAIGRTGAVEPPPLPGVLDQPVYRYGTDSLSAVVSDYGRDTIRPERRHIGAAQRVLAALNARFDVLPMAFGTITKSEAALRSFLDQHCDSLSTQLQRISGAVEMGLRLTLQVDDPVAWLVAQTPALQVARDRTFRGGRPPSHDAKVRLGQMVDEALGQYREDRTNRVLAALASSCAEVIALPVRGDREIANLAALVPRAAIDKFEETVQASAAQIDDDIVVSVGGPWPPHNFVRLDG
ncbi:MULTISPECIES: GvpL/GvpF family gas vesicle protein [unclassified Bradyrhizobium]|uniref:GvpL/GvpF family gas vesicle protein n=1 Tax=unclassified Bradyrhizobium TaxID=2631580 RepID=UPI002916B96D|nr:MULTISPECIES: GvpL/GvpF family gas vesicle protein [unclassified Bradyrhizobium]